MPIIPRYTLSQTLTHVHIEVCIPHVRVSTSTLELVIDDKELHLYAPPAYLLKLILPQRVVDEDLVEESLANAVTGGGGDGEASVSKRLVEETVSNGLQPSQLDVCQDETTQLWTKEDLPKLQYNPEKNHGTLVIILRKEQDGHWEDLDLLGRLQHRAPHRGQVDDVVPGASGKSKPLVNVIEEQLEKSGAVDRIDDTDVMDDLVSVQKTRPSYGLFQHYSSVFRDYAREGLAHEMLECPNPDEMYENEDMSEALETNRREMRLEVENDKFDPDRYLADLNISEEGDMIFDSAMKMSRISSQHYQRKSTISQTLTSEQQRSAYLSLLDVLIAYAYDHRTTDGDATVESSWTVMILSPSLSWLESYNPPYDTVAEVVRWCIRRTLIYPYLRSYTLARTLVKDVCQILLRGRRTVIRCLLQLHRILEKSEAHYLFNKLYIDPLIGWMQQCEEKEVQDFGREVHEMLSDGDGDGTLGKECLNLGLVELEESFLAYDDDSSSSEEDDESVDYESDDESGGDTLSTTDVESTEAKRTVFLQVQSLGIAAATTSTAGGDTPHRSSALLDYNIGLQPSTLEVSKDVLSNDVDEMKDEGKLVELMQSLDFEQSKKRMVEET
eukprot:g4521.t1 g4521   contig15:1196506-1198417(-)